MNTEDEDEEDDNELQRLLEEVADFIHKLPPSMLTPARAKAREHLLAELSDYIDWITLH